MLITFGILASLDNGSQQKSVEAGLLELKARDYNIVASGGDNLSRPIVR